MLFMYSFRNITIDFLVLYLFIELIIFGRRGNCCLFVIVFLLLLLLSFVYLLFLFSLMFGAYRSHFLKLRVSDLVLMQSMFTISLFVYLFTQLFYSIYFFIFFRQNQTDELVSKVDTFVESHDANPKDAKSSLRGWLSFFRKAQRASMNLKSFYDELIRIGTIQRSTLLVLNIYVQPMIFLFVLYSVSAHSHLNIQY